MRRNPHVSLTSTTSALWYWLPVFAYTALIFAFSSLSDPEVYLPPLVADLWDKLLHAIEYGLLAILCYRAFRHAAGARLASHAVWLAIMVSGLYGLTDEFHQAFVPFRQADVWDLCADVIGASVAALAWHYFMRESRTDDSGRPARYNA